MSVAFGVVGVDGTGSPTTNVIVDILKNGTSIFTTTKINFAHATPAVTPSSYGDLVTLAPVTFAAGDVLSIDITTIYNGTSPTQPINLTVGLLLARANAPLPALTVTGSF